MILESTEDEITILEDAPELEPADMAPPPLSSPPVISPELQALLLAMNAQTLAAIAEMKKPTPEEQEKIEAARERNRQAKASALRQGEVSLAQQRAMQAACAHTQPNGKTSFRGQVNSDNCYRLYCHNCHYTSPPIHVTPEQISGGLNLATLDASRFTIEGLERAALASPPPDPIQRIPMGMVVDNTDL